MINSKRSIFASAALALCLSFPQIVDAEIFKNSEFLNWSRESQEYYFRTNIGMAGLIAGRNDKLQGKCIEDWYFSDEATSGNHIREVMRNYPDHHPRGIILAVLEKRCGKLIYN